jgi:hypothetical protein
MLLWYGTQLEMVVEKAGDMTSCVRRDQGVRKGVGSVD